MKRKVISVFLALCMMLSVVPIIGTTVFAEASGDFEYSVLSEDEQTCQITKYNGTATELTIPSELDGYTVTSIGYGAFYCCTSLVIVTIPDSVTSIGHYAFENCTSIESIIIPYGVTNIGNSAFDGCKSLATVTIPDSVTNIDGFAFYGCVSLTSITIPDSVTSIGSFAFCDCTSLTAITIPDSVTSISDSAFSGCTALTSMTIPDSVTSIGSYAFSGCTALTSMTIPDSVTGIGGYAFYGCSSLTGITIPDSVTKIGYCAFEHCNSMENIYVGSGNTNYCDINGVLFNKELTELIQYPVGNTRTSYEIPDSVTSLGHGAFEDCTLIESITIPYGVTSIGEYAFCGCSSLVGIIVPDSVTNIGDYAFCDCTSLISITIPDNVTSIGDYAFENCTSMENIYVGSGNANYCDINGVLFDKELTELIQYPVGNIRTSYEIPHSVTSIGDYAFENCTSIESITIPDSVMSIGDYAFDNCTSLTSITIPDSVTSIGGWAFYGCTSLTSITIPDSVTSISRYTFRCCDLLTIYGYRGSYAETYANENGIPFVALKSIVQFDKSQIRFRGVGADKDFSNYKDTFDVRTVAKISQEDFCNTFGTDEEAIKNITDIGFIYAAEKNVTSFDLETAKAVAEGTGTDENYIKKPVSYIQHAGDGADYIFTCIITDVHDKDREQKGYCYAYVCCNGTYYYFDDVTVMDFNALYTANKPQA